MSLSTNTSSGPTDSNKRLAIVPTIPSTSTTSPYPTKYNFVNIYYDIKFSNDKHHSDMKAMNYQISDMNDHISAILAKFTDTSSMTYKQEEKLTDLSSQLPTYE